VANAVSALLLRRLILKFSCAQEGALGVRGRVAGCKLTPNRQLEDCRGRRQHGVHAFGAQLPAELIAQLFDQRNIDPIEAELF